MGCVGPGCAQLGRAPPPGGRAAAGLRQGGRWRGCPWAEPGGSRSQPHWRAVLAPRASPEPPEAPPCWPPVCRSHRPVWNPGEQEPRCWRLFQRQLCSNKQPLSWPASAPQPGPAEGRQLFAARSSTAAPSRRGSPRLAWGSCSGEMLCAGRRGLPWRRGAAAGGERVSERGTVASRSRTRGRVGHQI